MQARLQRLRDKSSAASGNTGLASDFSELAHAKVRDGGHVALVLPLSALSGGAWEDTRKKWREHYHDTIAVTIAGADNDGSSFSADTGMAECLVVTRNGAPPLSPRATFAVLNEQPLSSTRSALVAEAIHRAIDRGDVRKLENGPTGGTPILLGEEYCGYLLDCPLDEGDWPVAGIADAALAQTAYWLERGALPLLGSPHADPIAIHVTAIGNVSNRGPYASDINWSYGDGTPRGPFELVKPPHTTVPTYPML